MGTNYYLYKQPACAHCGHRPEPVHIGRSAAGWVFMLHVTPECPTLTHWIDAWRQPGVTIEDEYGRVLSSEEMLRIITCRSGQLLRPSDDVGDGWTRGAGSYDLSTRNFS